MIIGVDLDGTIMGRAVDFSYLNLPPYIARFFLKGQVRYPNRRMIERMRRYKKNGDVVYVVTARRKELEEFSKRQLAAQDVPFGGLFCVGNGRGAAARKLEKARTLGLDVFFDDNVRVVRMMRAHGVEAILVTSDGFSLL